MNIRQELAENQTVLLLLPGTEYNRAIVDTAKSLRGKKICYITLNRTYQSLQQLFAKHNAQLKDTTYVDVITLAIKKPDESPKNVHFFSPKELAGAFAHIGSLLTKNYDYLVFDSLTNLFSYKDTEDVEAYIFILINKIRQTKTKAVLYALDEQETLIPRCCMYVDKTTHYTP